MQTPITFGIFNPATVERKETKRGTAYTIKSGVGRCTVERVRFSDAAYWLPFKSKLTVRGERLRHFYDQRDFFLYQRGGTVESYVKFYAAHHPASQAALIFDADEAAYREAAKRAGVTL